MDMLLLRHFQNQVVLQAHFIILAVHHLDAARKKHDIPRTFYALQNLLNAAANISKALWGSKGKRAAQRKPLRDSIGIDDQSPLREVTMRNNYEHFDERLDTWWNESPNHNAVDLSVMPRNAIPGIPTNGWFRVYDPLTGNLTFWDEDFNVQAIINEIERILPKLEEEANKPPWQTPQPKPTA